MNTKLSLNEAISILIATSLLVLSACADSSKSGAAQAGDDHGHDHGPGGHTHAAAKPTTPHGGTPVQVGDHAFHLEFVPDPVEGKMLAYVFDAHMEESVTVVGAPFELVAKANGQEQRYTFHPVTNAPNASAEKTSVFSAAFRDGNSMTNFEGVIPKITLDGKSFENVTFSYPKGSRHEH